MSSNVHAMFSHRRMEKNPYVLRGKTRLPMPKFRASAAGARVRPNPTARRNHTGNEPRIRRLLTSSCAPHEHLSQQPFGHSDRQVNHQRARSQPSLPSTTNPKVHRKSMLPNRWPKSKCTKLHVSHSTGSALCRSAASGPGIAWDRTAWRKRPRRSPRSFQPW